MGSIANLGVFSSATIACTSVTHGVELDVYHELVLFTAAPICVIVAILLGTAFVKMSGKDQDSTQRVADSAFALIFGVTYMVFTSASASIVKIFNCRTFGDDSEVFMMSDPSISCDTLEYKNYSLYATAMLFVYPVGIPTLYFVMLWRARKELQMEDRGERASLHKIAFLWDDYEPSRWWFEPIDCIRRLSMSALLQLFFMGQASQVVVALIISFVSVVVFVHFRPFVKDAHDNLAIVSQTALFFTLLAALIRKANFDRTDGYDEGTFGGLLIGINTIGVVMVAIGVVMKPIRMVINALTSKHVHAAPLTGVGQEHDSWVEFER
jgi:hypothetical protein